MVRYTFSSPRNDVSDLADKRKELAEIDAKIAKGDKSLKEFCIDPMNEYDPCAKWQKERVWNVDRRPLAKRQAELRREIGWLSDNSYRPASGAVWRRDLG
jgi:hypothetical protein